MSENYKIGQVLYIVSETIQQVIPVQIVEIHKRESIDGEEVVFMVQDPKETGPHDLDEIDGEIFTNHSEVFSFLKSQAGKAIDHMVNVALAIAKEKFNINETVFKTTTPKKRGRKPKEHEEEQEQGLIQKNESDTLETQDVRGNVQQLKIGKVIMPDFKEPSQPSK